MMFTRGVLALSVLLISTGAAFGQGKPADPDAKAPARPTLTQEEREQMAKHHEAMAACLRSDKDIKVCHEEMAAQCKAESEGGMCPMMRHNMKEHKKMHGKGRAQKGMQQ